MFTKPYSDLDSTDLYTYDPGYDTNGIKERIKISFLNAKDDRQSSGNVFNPDNKPNLPRIDGEGKATQLKNKMLSYKGFLINILETAKDSNLIPIRNYDDLNSLIEEINVTIDIPDKKYGKQGNKRTWEYHNFYDMPAVATLNFLSTQHDIVKNLQSRVISFLESNSDAATLEVQVAGTEPDTGQTYDFNQPSDKEITLMSNSFNTILGNQANDTKENKGYEKGGIPKISEDDSFLNFAAKIKKWKYNKLKFSKNTKYLLIF